MVDAITGRDIDTLRRARAAGTKWNELSDEDLSVYRKADACLRALAEAAITRLNGQGEFKYVLTSGFTTTSGVRGYLPKDLWLAIYLNENEDDFVGMPQLYVIVSERGIEYGLAAAIHRNDFSSQAIKDKLKEAVPRIFDAFPSPDSDLVRSIGASLEDSEGWRYRRKTRESPNGDDFANLEKLVNFLKSEPGQRWGAAAVCRYLSPADLDAPGFDLQNLFEQTVELFAPLMRQVKSAGLPLPQPTPPLPTASGSTMQETIERFLELYPAVKQGTPFGQHDEIWGLMGAFCDEGLQDTRAVSSHPHIRIKWSVGAGNWATVPWVALLDDRETNSTQRGVYVVFLFREDMSGVYVTLNQGVTDINNQHGRAQGRNILRERADQLGALVPELSNQGFIIDGNIDLRTHSSLGQDYEHSTVAYKLYSKGVVPSDAEIDRDLQALLSAYEKVLDTDQIDIEPMPPVTKPPGDQRIWLIAPGRDAAHWDDFYRDGIVAIGWDEISDLSGFDDIETITDALVEAKQLEKRPTMDARALYEFAHVMKPGDLVFAKKGRSIIVGYGLVTGDYVFNSERRTYRHTRMVRWEGRGNWRFEGLLALKTLTDITSNRETVQAIQELVELIDVEEPTAVPPEQLEPFTVDEAVVDLFMTNDEFVRILDVWRRKKNIILQGPPGVGKTFIAHRLAFALMGYRDRSRLGMVQFHQSYSYEDFIQGYRPSGEGFNLKDGLFYDFCKRASKDQDAVYVFVIDEINRGNLSKILGELMVLIEPDKRGPGWSMPLTYSESSDQQFFVPENLFLLGMMNTADRSLSLVDYALRRRFAFLALRPEFKSEKFHEDLERRAAEPKLINAIVERMTSLNEAIAVDTTNLGPGFCIGHSFFCGDGDGLSPDENWYHQIVEAEILPLLEEYWFDHSDRVDEWRERLLSPL